MTVKRLSMPRPTSTRSRAVASIAAAALALVSVGVSTGVAQAVTPATNPDLTAGCGADLVLVLDDSNSLWEEGSYRNAVANAAQSFADGFRDTNSTLGVVRFNTTAATMSGVVPLTGTAFNNLDDDYLDGSRPSGSANGVGQGGTNWEAALSQANTLVSGGSSTRPKLVVMITDGQPTVSSDSGNGNSYSTGALDDGITQANFIKAKGAHVLTVGVGNAFDNNTYKAALASLSGKDVYPTGEWPSDGGYNRQGTLDFDGSNTTDSVLVSSFSDLSTAIANIAKAACQGSLTITKKVINAAGQTITTGDAVDGFSFAATRPNSNYSWVTPASGGTSTRTSVTGQGGNLNGTASFQWNITGATGNVSVAETMKPGATYALDSVVCDGSTKTVTNNTFSVAVPQNASVFCEVTNKETPRVDIRLDKSILGSAPYSVDTQRTYKLSVTNDGPAAATGVEVVDTLPAAFTSPSITAGTGASISGNTVTWAVGNLAVNETKNLEITGTLSTVGTLVNWAEVTKTTQVDNDSTPDNCSLSEGALETPEDDCDLVTIDVTRNYSLDIDKVRFGTGDVSVGDQVQFDLKVKNLGPSAASSGLVVTDTLPNNLTNVGFAGQGIDSDKWDCVGSPIAGPTNNTSFTCTYNAALVKDAVRVVRVTATIGNALADATSITNNACVKKGANSTSNDDCDDEPVLLKPKSDLTVTKTATPPSVQAGTAATWKYNVTNLGPSKKATPFTVTDTLPNGLVNVSISGGAGWSCSTSAIAGPTSNTTFTCTFTPTGSGLAVGGTTTDVVVTGTPNAWPVEGTTGSYKNKACVEDNFAGDQNDCSEATVTVTPKVDLTIDKKVDKATATVGDVLTYSFEVINNGPSAATTISFDDTFDAGLTTLTIESAPNWNCALTGQTLECTWTGGPVNSGGKTTTVVVKATVGAGLANSAKVDNTACVGIGVANDNNDCDTTTTNLNPKSDLTVTKTTSTPSVQIGGAATWTYNVTNLGPSTKTTPFTVTDTLPDGLSNVTISGGTGWLCLINSIPGPTSGSTFTCTFVPTGDGLAVNATTTDVTVSGTTTVAPAEGSTASLKNKACVEDGVAGDQNDCSESTVTVTPKVDLTVDKEVDKATGTVGQQLTYTITVTNDGPSKATAPIVVTDTLPDGLTIDSVSGDGWVCDTVGQAVTCTSQADLAKDEDSEPITIKATIGVALADASSVSNTACVADTIQDEDCDTTTTELDPTSDLATTKVATASPIQIGESAGWSYTVKNLGPSKKLAPFTVTDTLPDGLTDVVITPAAEWACSTTNVAGPTSGTSFTCTYTPDEDGLAVNESTSAVSLTATTNAVPAEGSTASLLNQACVSDGKAEDQNDCSEATVVVNPKVDLTVDKGVDVTSGATVGDQLTYTITVTNDGPSKATAPIVVTDTLNADLTIDEVSGEGWACNTVGQAVTCTSDADLDLGEDSEPITIKATVGVGLADAESVSNTACVADLIEDEDCSTTTTELDPTFDLVIDKEQVEANPVTIGSTVNYTLTVYNQGPSKATSGFVVTDDVPSPLEVTEVDGGEDWNCDASTGNAVSCTFVGDDLAVGPAPAITVTSTVGDGAQTIASVENIACVAEAVKPDREDFAAVVIDEQLSECDSVVTEFPKTAGIEVVKTGSRAPGELNQEEDDFFDSVAGVRGQVTVFRFAVTNTGNQPITDVALEDEMNFGPSLGVSVLDELNEDDLTNCRVGNSATPNDGSSQSFTMGDIIGDDSVITIEGGDTVYLYCDLLIPADLDEELLDLNRIFNISAVEGSTPIGDVDDESDEVVVKVFPEAYDAYPIKNITDEDGTNPRAFDFLGESTEPTIKTFRMTVDNVSDRPLDFTLYDYYENDSLGLSEAERDAIFDSMVCIDYDDPEGDFGGVFPNPILDAGYTEIYDQGPEDTTYGETSDGGHEGTYYARGYELGVIEPGGGYEIACQVSLPAGEYELVNTFRMVANEVEVAGLNRAAAAVEGVVDLSASAGVILGDPTVIPEEPSEPGTPDDDTEVLGGKIPAALPRTGSPFSIGSMAMLGFILVGAGALLATQRRRDAAGEI
jgi:uncharacterized repeat protein (TIGR01451 family)/LPXTG-motif cell wall-anchored protein